jgi:hypothetical protein
MKNMIVLMLSLFLSNSALAGDRKVLGVLESIASQDMR